MTSKEAEGRLEVIQVKHLHQFVLKGNKIQIKKLAQIGVENLLNLIEPKCGTGALHLAVSANNLDMASFLLSLGAIPDIQDRRGCSPAMLAAQKGNDALVSLLAKHNANMGLQDVEGRSMLFYCIYPTKRHLRCLEVALRHHADVNNVSKKGIHVFLVMCGRANHCTPMCLAMLDAGTDANATNQTTGVTALMEAAKSGSVQVVRAILKKGGRTNAVDHKGLSAVHYAAMGGFLEVLQVLCAHSADMTAATLRGNTPLHYAAAVGSAKCCKFLAEKGCDTKLKNHNGLLPRQIAKDSGHKQAAKELRKAQRLQGKLFMLSSITCGDDIDPGAQGDLSEQSEQPQQSNQAITPSDLT